VEWLREREPDWRINLREPEAQIEWLRDQDVAKAAGISNPAFRDARWDGVLKGFPDRTAAARAVRIMAWNVLKFSLGETRDFDNNFEDAEYAIAASSRDARPEPDTVDEGSLPRMRAVRRAAEGFGRVGTKKLERKTHRRMMDAGETQRRQPSKRGTPRDGNKTWVAALDLFAGTGQRRGIPRLTGGDARAT
jgi:hypothetical protein